MRKTFVNIYPTRARSGEDDTNTRSQRLKWSGREIGAKREIKWEKMQRWRPPRERLRKFLRNITRFIFKKDERRPNVEKINAKHGALGTKTTIEIKMYVSSTHNFSKHVRGTFFPILFSSMHIVMSDERTSIESQLGIKTIRTNRRRRMGV